MLLHAFPPTPCATRFHLLLSGGQVCQCRKARIRRNHIACAVLVWTRLKAIAYQSGKTIYQIKHGMLSNDLIAQLKHSSVQMSLA